MKFKMDTLKTICKIKGISTKKEVRDPYDPYSVKLVEIRNKDELVKILADKLSLEEIIQYAKKYGISYKEELEDLKNFEKELFSEKEEEKQLEIGYESRSKIKNKFEEVLNIIKEQFKPEAVRNEEDLEKQLYQFLSAKLGKERVKRQVQIGQDRIDLVIDDKYGIEVKIADKSQKLKTLIGQVMHYKDKFDGIIAVILDVGAITNIEEHVKKLEEVGASVVRLSGTVKRQGKGKGGTIIIKYK